MSDKETWRESLAMTFLRSRATMRERRNSISGRGIATYLIDVRVIAGVNGRAVGVGCQLSETCDTCVAWDEARLAELLVNVGLSAGDAGILRKSNG